MKSKCSFCEIADGWATKLVLYENQHAIVYAPFSESLLAAEHIIAIPKVHYSNYLQMPPQVMAEVYRAIQKVAFSLNKQFNFADVEIYSNGPLLRTPDSNNHHIHFHIIPRKVKVAPK